MALNPISGNWDHSFNRMPDVEKIKTDLHTYHLAGYSVSWSIARVVADYRLWHWRNKGNAWIDDLVKTYIGAFPNGTRHTYI